MDKPLKPMTHREMAVTTTETIDAALKAQKSIMVPAELKQVLLAASVLLRELVRREIARESNERNEHAKGK